MTEPLVVAEKQGRVLVVLLNRPSARNALSSPLRQALIQVLRGAASDADVGAVVISGAGSAFAAGADLGELLERTSAQQEAFLQPPHIYSVIEQLDKPVIAAINGHALGAGLELATACDVRICSDGAKLGQPEINFALIPGGGGTQRLARLVGHGVASRLIMTGTPMTAEDARRVGLVDEVCPAAEVLTRAVTVATTMAGHDPDALAAAKLALRAARDETYPEGLAREIGLFVRLHAREESQRRIQAFLDKKDKA